MKSIDIDKVAMLNEKISIFPSEIDPWYEYVYREAAGVSWNKSLLCFQPGNHLGEWDYSKWFIHIIEIVKIGLRIDLRLSEKTQFEPELEEFSLSIIAAYSRAFG
jgi:hypothetical protein